MILFPVKSSKPRKGDASEEDIKKATQLEGRVLPGKYRYKYPRLLFQIKIEAAATILSDQDYTSKAKIYFS